MYVCENFIIPWRVSACVSKCTLYTDTLVICKLYLLGERLPGLPQLVVSLVYCWSCSPADSHRSADVLSVSWWLAPHWMKTIVYSLQYNSICVSAITLKNLRPRNACNALVSPSKCSVRNVNTSVVFLLRKKSLTQAYANSYTNTNCCHGYWSCRCMCLPCDILTTVHKHQWWMLSGSCSLVHWHSLLVDTTVEQNPTPWGWQLHTYCHRVTMKQKPYTRGVTVTQPVL